MPTTLDQLQQFSDKVALAIHNSIITEAIEAAFADLKGTSAKCVLPMPATTARTDIAARLELVGAPPTVTARGAAEPLFDISAFKAAIVVYAKRDPEERLITFDCEVPASVIRLNLDSNQKLVADFDGPANQPLVTPTVTHHLADPVDPNALRSRLTQYFANADEYYSLAAGTEITIRSTLPSLILSGIALPAFAASCDFTFIAPHLARTEDYTLIVSDRIEGALSTSGDPNCPRGHDAKRAVRVAPVEGPRFQAVVEHDRVKEPVNTPRHWNDMPRFALTLPKIVFQGLVLGAFKPAVPDSRKGQFLLIYWDYFAVAVLDSTTVTPVIKSADVEVEATGTIKIKGAASAGITLGCVRHQVLGATLESTVRVGVRIGFEWDNALGEIRLYSYFTDPKVDLDFLFASNRFPLDQVISLIVGEILKNVVYRKVVHLLNAIRVSVLDLAKLLTPRGPVNVARHAANPEALIIAPDWEG